jgi:hypothetical protein
MSTEIELPLPAQGMPMVARLISEAIDKKEQSLIWALAQTHPLAENFKIVRMFIVSEPDGVEIYSVSSDAKTGMRDRIPWERIMIVGEVMPTLDVFVDELAAAEGEEDDDEIEPPDSPPATIAASSNGQPAS